MSTLSPRRVALIGLMGAGKSRVGALVARTLDWPFADADTRIEALAGKLIATIFAEESEAGFRDRESRVVAELAGMPPPLVAALGGGAVLREENQELLKTAFHVVWLRVDPEEAARRVQGSSRRPLLEGTHPEEALKRLEANRAPLYAELADLVVDTGPETRPEDRCQVIVEALAALR